MGFLRYYCADLNQILYESFQVQENENAGHMTKMAATPIYGKKPSKKLLLRSGRADFHETWYVALGTPAHNNLFKWWPWSDIDLFYGKVKFGILAFSKGKKWKEWIFQKQLQPVTWKVVVADI